MTTFKLALLGIAVALVASTEGETVKKLAKPLSILAMRAPVCVRLASKKGFAATKLLAVDEGPGFNEVVQYCKWENIKPRTEKKA